MNLITRFKAFLEHFDAPTQRPSKKITPHTYIVGTSEPVDKTFLYSNPGNQFWTTLETIPDITIGQISDDPPNDTRVYKYWDSPDGVVITDLVHELGYADDNKIPGEYVARGCTSLLAELSVTKPHFLIFTSQNTAKWFFQFIHNPNEMFTRADKPPGVEKFVEERIKKGVTLGRLPDHFRQTFQNKAETMGRTLPPEIWILPSPSGQARSRFNPEIWHRAFGRMVQWVRQNHPEYFTS